MAQSQQQRQKALEKKAKKRKDKVAVLRQHHHAIGPGEHGNLHSAGTWPIIETLLTEEWDTPGGLVEALVARRSPTGRIVAGVFLVDLGCLGVKDAFVRSFDSHEEYDRMLREHLLATTPKIPGDLDLIAKIIREAIGYAAELGFHPAAGYADAARLLAGADPKAAPERIPLGGPEGKPFFFAGPHDNVPAIMARLERRLGPDGFNFMAQIGDPMVVFDSDEMKDWEDEDEEEENLIYLNR